LGVSILLELRKRVHKIVQRLALTDNTRRLFLKYHIITYLIFLNCGFVLARIKETIARIPGGLSEQIAIEGRNSW